MKGFSRVASYRRRICTYHNLLAWYLRSAELCTKARVGFAKPFASGTNTAVRYERNKLCTFWDDVGSVGATYTLTCTGKMRSSHCQHKILDILYSEPQLGRYVTLQKISEPEWSWDLNWAEVRVESSYAASELEEEEDVGVLVDSTIM